MDDAARLYLDLMKRCLTNTVYAGPELAPVRPQTRMRKALVRALARNNLVLARSRPEAFEARAKGLDNNPRAHTMIGLARLDNVQYCVERALDDEVPGDLIETGVWRGGATAFMRAILKARGVTDRVVWVADSFQGLPRPDAERYPLDKGDTHHQYEWLAVSREDVMDTFRCYDLLDDQVRFLEGWFNDTLPNAPIDRLAVMRLDGDMYQSTVDALQNLYPKLSVGGFVILDDWRQIPVCKRAIDDFRAQHGITETIHDVDGNAGYWRRER